MLPTFEAQQEAQAVEAEQVESPNGTHPEFISTHRDSTTTTDSRRLSLEDLAPDCNAIGNFERLGERDIAFVCDYCDGHIVWEDTQKMPSARTSATQHNGTEYPNWQAPATSMSTAEDKTIVFAPVVIANHLAPPSGEWESRILCPYCEDYTYFDQGDGEDTKYAQDEGGFTNLRAFQEHLQWYHTALPVPSLASTSIAPSSDQNCILM